MTIKTSPFAGRVPPHSVEAEEYLLGCILIDGGETLVKAMTLGLTEEAFYVSANRLIYSQLVSMLAAGKPIELVTLVQQLKESKDFEAVGGYPYLTQVSGCIPTTAQAGFFIQKIIENYQLRQVIIHATKLVEDTFAYHGQGVAALMQRPMMDLINCSNSGPSEEETWDKITDEAMEYVDSVIANQGIPAKKVINWPFPEMDRLFGTVERGSLVTLVGVPSSGKSSLARQWAASVAADGMGVYFNTYEVKPMRVVLNMAQAATRIGMKVLAAAHPRDQEDVRAAIFGLKKQGIHMSRKDRTLSRLVARAKALHGRAPLSLIVVDHGLLMDDVMEATKEEREVVIGRVTGTLKKLAEELDCVVLLLWQFIASAVRQGTNLKASDMKGSSDLEANSDRVILIEHPETNPLTKESQAGQIHVSKLARYYKNLIQAKGRDDGVATLGMEYIRELACFTQIEKTESPTQEELY